MSDKLEQNNLNDNEWSFEAEQNWLGFWNLILQEDIRQNPEYYKKLKEENNENNRDTNNTD